MAITVSPVQQPIITLNNAPLDLDVVSSGLSVTKAGVTTANAPAVLRITAGAGATIRYTLNGRNPNLGSTVYDGPITLRENTNGFSSSRTIVKAKAYVNGDSSVITRAEIKIHAVNT